MLKDNGEFIKYLYGKYAMPSVMALLAGAISTFLNTTMAGTFFGSEGLEAVGFFMPVFFIFSTMGALIGVGSANACSKAIAKNDFRLVKSAFSLATLYCVAVGIAACLAALLFSQEIMLFLTGDKIDNQALQPYFRYSVVGGVLSMYLYVPLNFTKIDGKPKVSLYMFLTMFAVNLLANMVFFFGLGMGVEALAAGAAVGTLAAVLTGGFFIFFQKGNVRFIKPYAIREITANMVVLGAPMALNNFYNFLRVMLINFLLVSIGASSAVGIFAVLTTVTTFVMAIASGLGQALVMPVAVFSNRNDRESIRLIAKHAFKAGNLIFIGITVAILLCNPLLCKLFSLDGPEVHKGAQIALLFFAASLLPALNNMIFSFYYTAIYRVRIANAINVCRGLLFVVTMAWVLAQFLGQTGVWAALVMGEVLTLDVIRTLVEHVRKKETANNKQLSFPLLLEDFSEEEQKYIAFSVREEDEDIAGSSEHVHEFCESIKLDPEESMFLSMSVEEIIMFIKTKRQKGSGSSAHLNHISVRIYVTPEAKTITFMYSGKPFNPIAYFEEEIAGDFEKSLEVIGIKFIIERAQKIDFAETFGVNNLSIFL